MRKIALAAALFATSLLFTAQPARTQDPSTVVSGIQKKYASINDLSSPFTQVTRIKDLDEKIASSGKVWFKKPGMMKWQYQEPWKDTIVSDGKKVWYFDSRENQVTEMEIESVWADSLGSYTIISILEDLDRLFDVRPGAGSADERGNVLLDLKQKNREQSKQVTIAVDPKTYMLREIIIGDVFGNTTVIKLGAAEVNLGIADLFFSFKKPKGARMDAFP
ncbi:MAG: outer membrane lipoprotein carrier protein LolA [Candidatus Dadabacteria bacterium]|nr:outer membrane lipoprotein carrier protein LolA [Candidatus Dadabacteria bacterium]MDE0663605.1 outer membrane lipoprotein carrier protein LolA [Candidatus Dadabacteria bacterium]